MLTFALCSPSISVCTMLSILHLSLVFARSWLQPMRPSSSALVGGRSRVPSHKFVQPGCTATTTLHQASGRVLRSRYVKCLLTNPSRSMTFLHDAKCSKPGSTLWRNLFRAHNHQDVTLDVRRICR